MKAVTLSLLVAAPTALAAWTETAGSSIEYASVPGFFLQDDNSTEPSGFDYVRDPTA